MKQSNNNLDVRLVNINLFDLYKELLTQKQQNYFIDYYFNDLSLSEMANEYNVSRNAILDSLQNVIKLLNDYEQKLKLYETKNLVLQILDSENNIESLKNKIRDIDLFRKD